MVPKRITDPTRVELEDAERQLRSGSAVVVQFSNPCYNDELLAVVNSLAAQFGRSLEVRFYSHPGESFDCAILRSVPSVVNLSIDCLQLVSDVEVLAQLFCLEELSIGIEELADTKILGYPNLRSLRALSVGPTKSKSIDLAFLGEYSHLERLRICGHTQGIAALTAAPSLRSLALDGIGKQTRLGFLSKLAGLQGLRLLLGGRVSIAEVDIPDLRDLELCRVRDLSDLGDLSRFRRLESFVIDDQAKVESVAFSPAHAELRLVRISTCKSVREVVGLEALPKLEHLVIGETTLDRDALLSLKLPPKLRLCSMYTGKEREDQLIRAALALRGYGRN